MKRSALFMKEGKDSEIPYQKRAMCSQHKYCPRKKFEFFSSQSLRFPERTKKIQYELWTLTKHPNRHFFKAIGAPIAENIPWKKEEYANDWSIVYRKKKLYEFFLGYDSFLAFGEYFFVILLLLEPLNSHRISIFIITALKKIMDRTDIRHHFSSAFRRATTWGKKIAGRFCLSFL